MPLEAPSDVAPDLVPVEAVFSVRAFGGSREALLRAAMDLLDLSLGLEVQKRSLVWRQDDPPHGLCAAFLVEAQHPIDALIAGAEALARRLNGAAPPVTPPVLELVLAWAHEQRGPAPPPPRDDSAAMPPLPRDLPAKDARLAQPAPPLPPGRIYVHPAARQQAWVAAPLAEVKGDAQDPTTGRYLGELLYGMTEHLVSAPVPFRSGFSSEVREVEGRLFSTVAAQSRADALAAVAEALGGAQPCAQVIGPATVFPEEVWPVSLAGAPLATPAARFTAWTEAVHATLTRERARLRRAVILEDSPGRLEGRLFGARHEGPKPYVPLPRAQVQLHPQRGELWEATLSRTIAGRGP